VGSFGLAYVFVPLDINTNATHRANGHECQTKVFVESEVLLHCSSIYLPAVMRMTLDKIRNYLATTLLISAGNIFYMGAIVWVITYFIPLEGVKLRVTYIVVYLVISFFTLRFYLPRLRNAM
jgi:VIT1/CCC1 family predicted Fe2+/Mn2+ transporter